MKNTLLIIPALVIAITAITLPKPESTFSIESLSMTKENKSFANLSLTDSILVGSDGNSYYTGQNVYHSSSNGDVYYTAGNGYAYNGSGNFVHIGGVFSNGKLSHYSLNRFLKNTTGFPQPRLAFAKN